MNQKERPLAFHEVWYLKLNDPDSQRALALQFSTLSSANGFRRIAENCAVFFQRSSQQDVKKLAVKQTYDIRDCTRGGRSAVRIAECHLTESSTTGIIQSKGNSIEWNLTFVPGLQSSFTLIPEILNRTGMMKNSAVTLSEQLLFSGTTKVNGETVVWREAPGMQGHRQEPRNNHSWIWAHCNSFVDEQGKPEDFIFEGISAKSQIGPILTPQISSFFFYYQGRSYYFNTIRDLFSLKSKSTLNEWHFQAERNDISFRGTARAEHKDFAGLTLEDTNGSLLYCSSSRLSDIEIVVYKQGKLATTLRSRGTASLEIVGREKNPYVPILL